MITCEDCAVAGPRSISDVGLGSIASFRSRHIALSILLLASEILRRQRGEPSLTATWPWAVAFSFGLLHGLGFASALIDIGLPQGDVPIALLAFNIGVEVGQLAFIAAVLGVMR